MSLETWKAKYYPIAVHKKADWTEAEALQHSLNKWLGLRRAKLAEHDLIKSTENSAIFGVLPQVRFTVDGSTCALCALYFDTHFGDCACANCPLFKIRGRRCDERSKNGGVSPYQTFVKTGNPEPMIDLLKRAISDKNGE